MGTTYSTCQFSAVSTQSCSYTNSVGNEHIQTLQARAHAGTHTHTTPQPPSQVHTNIHNVHKHTHSLSGKPVLTHLYHLSVGLCIPTACKCTHTSAHTRNPIDTHTHNLSVKCTHSLPTSAHCIHTTHTLPTCQKYTRAHNFSVGVSAHTNSWPAGSPPHRRHPEKGARPLPRPERRARQEYCRETPLFKEG